jgi:amino acid transporter
MGKGHQLAANSLSIGESIIMGVAGAAPAFSIVTALLVLSDQEILKAETNIIFVMANKIFPKPWSYLAILCVVLSSIGTLETTILQFTRTLFALGRDEVMHSRYALLHQTKNSPWVATLVIWVFGMIFLFLSSYSSTVHTLMKDSMR